MGTAGRRDTTCDDCYFRRAELCAIPGNVPCPTFRAARRLEPPPQPSLVARQPEPEPAVAIALA